MQNIGCVGVPIIDFLQVVNVDSTLTVTYLSSTCEEESGSGGGQKAMAQEIHYIPHGVLLSPSLKLQR